MMLYAVDPGTTHSAIVGYRDGRLVAASKQPNDEVRDILIRNPLAADHLAVEMVACYGKPVGAEVFQTCLWIGRFLQVWERAASLVYRRDIKLNLCGSGNTTDAYVRRALIDRFGPGDAVAIGKKASPGPLYGLAGDQWAALAVAVTWCDMNPHRMHPTTAATAAP